MIAAEALPSTAGAVTAITSASPYEPPTRFREELGFALTVRSKSLIDKSFYSSLVG